MFKLMTDPDTNLKYTVKTVGEAMKNHKQNDQEPIKAHMSEVRDSKYCPVKSFMMYVTKLHPKINAFWQQLKELKKIQDSDIWYKPLKIGEKPLASFISRMSHEAELSYVYTNHSIRCNGITFMKRYTYSEKQMMTMSGHKSVNSLAIYQHVSSNEKLSMGMSMSYHLQSDHPPNSSAKYHFNH